MGRKRPLFCELCCGWLSCVVYTVGARVLTSWTSECSHLVMNTINVTVKVDCPHSLSPLQLHTLTPSLSPSHYCIHTVTVTVIGIQNPLTSFTLSHPSLVTLSLFHTHTHTHTGGIRSLQLPVDSDPSLAGGSSPLPERSKGPPQLSPLPTRGGGQ